MTDTQSILNAAAQLPEHDRLHIVEVLLESLGTSDIVDSAEISDAWRVEVLRRSEKLRSGEVTAIPWANVQAEGESLLNRGD